MGRGKIEKKVRGNINSRDQNRIIRNFRDCSRTKLSKSKSFGTKLIKSEIHGTKLQITGT